MKLSAASSADVSGTTGSGGADCVVGGASTVTVGSSAAGGGVGRAVVVAVVVVVAGCGGGAVPGGSTSTSGRSTFATIGFDASIAFVMRKSDGAPSAATGAFCGGETTRGPPISGFGTGGG